MMSQEQGSIAVDRRGDVTCITFRYPELDITQIPQIEDDLRAAIDDADPPRFVLDLTGVRYIPTVGIGMLMGILIKIRKQGGEFRLAGLCPEIKGLLAMVRLDTVFQIYDDVADAMASLD